MKKLSTKEMKKIAYEIVSKELEKYDNINVHIFPVTTLEYYTKYIKKLIKFYIDNEIHLDKSDFLELIKEPFSNTLAYNQMFDVWIDSQITKFTIFTVIFIKKIKKMNLPLINLLVNCYHEARHSIQLTFDNYSYVKFLRYIDGILIDNNNTDYNKNHNSYSIEIGANLYGITKAEEFLKNKYPDIYELEIETIKNYEKKYKLDYMLFDATVQIDKALNIANEKQINLNDKIPIFSIFMSGDNSFKSIEDMIKNPDFEKLDKRIAYTFLSSNSYLKNVDIEKLSAEEQTILNEALQYTYTIYNNQYKFIWKMFNNEDVNFKFFIETAEGLIKKRKYIDEKIKLINNKNKIKQYELIKNNPN